MAKHEITVTTLAGSEVKLSVFGYTCLSQVRALSLRKFPRTAPLKRCNEWEFDMVRGGDILPSRRDDFERQKHYTCRYLQIHDTITLVRVLGERARVVTSRRPRLLLQS